jgi:hypothetical protein
MPQLNLKTNELNVLACTDHGSDANDAGHVEDAAICR